MNRTEFNAAFQTACQDVNALCKQVYARGYTDGTPRHMKAAPNFGLIGYDELAKVLIAKGVITEDEYYSAVLAGLAAEKLYYTNLLAT